MDYLEIGNDYLQKYGILKEGVACSGLTLLFLFLCPLTVSFSMRERERWLLEFVMEFCN